MKCINKSCNYHESYTGDDNYYKCGLYGREDKDMNCMLYAEDNECCIDGNIDALYDKLNELMLERTRIEDANKGI